MALNRYFSKMASILRNKVCPLLFFVISSKFFHLEDEKQGTILWCPDLRASNLQNCEKQISLCIKMLCWGSTSGLRGSWRLCILNIPFINEMLKTKGYVVRAIHKKPGVREVL